MRYRLTIVSVIAAALVVAVALLALSSRDEAPVERKQTEPFPDGLGIVAAFTATAAAGGAALDPTAFATPTSTPAPSVETISTETTGASSLVLGSPAGIIAPGESISVSISEASPGENVEVSINGGTAIASAIADAEGSASIEVPVPANTVSGPMTLTFSGTESGSSTITLDVRAAAPLVTIDPEELAPGDSITLNAEGFEPGESVIVEISRMPAGSAITGSDGSFSITTRLPNLPDAGSQSHEVSLRGDSGSVATSEITVAGSSGPVALEPTSTTVASSGVGKGPASNSRSGEQPGGSGQGEAGAGKEDGGTSVPGIGTAVEEQADPGEPDTSRTGIAPGDLQTWTYVVTGAVIGWLGMLTLWVVRVDRRRDRHIAALLLQLTSVLVANENSRRKQAVDSEERPVGGERAA